MAYIVGRLGDIGEGRDRHFCGVLGLDEKIEREKRQLKMDDEGQNG